MVYIGSREYKYRGMLMSHMIADTIDELHKMAELIGVDKKHFQNKTARQHYDICKSKKKLAFKNGAIECTEKRLMSILKVKEEIFKITNN